MHEQLTVLDLFSGIGGFSLGLERAGMRTIAFVEIDPFCRRVLAKHWPGVPVHDDIMRLDGARYAGAVDVVCGGYPCQPFSTAGKQQGEADPRHLWPEMRRVIREARPRWVVAENVRGHVGLGFDAVAAQLEADGFTVWPFIVPACAVGAPHRRERLWIVAHADRDRKQQPQGAVGEVRQRACDGGEAVAHAARELLDRAGPSGAARRAEPSDGGWWATEPAVGRVVDGLPGRVDRLRSLGNAVVPQVVELIGRAIMQYDKSLMHEAVYGLLPGETA